jgi:enolase
MAATTITGIRARELLDSRGKPTLEVTVACRGGEGTFGVPSGASTGTNEAVELRDGDKARYSGMGVRKAVANAQVNIASALVGMDAADQRAIDDRMRELDGTPNKSKLGGNAMVGVSVAAAKAAAAAQKLPVHEWVAKLAGTLPSRESPLLCMNLTNGGKHAAGRLAFQEYKVVPQTTDAAEAIEWGTRIMYALKIAYAKKYGPVNANIGDEGGFAPDLVDIRAPLELFMEVAADVQLDDRITVALDVAASSFYSADDDRYFFNGAKHTAAELETALRDIIRDFPVQYIEDPFNEDKFADFARMNADAGVVIVGDDLTVTNTAYLQKAVDVKAIGGVIIKLNQVGTLTETLDCIALARQHNIKCIVSHRSGETNDAFIADLAVATGAWGIKAGGPQRGERVAKYNRFLELLA